MALTPATASQKPEGYGFQFIWPGCGYGGSCFPKDVQALVRTAQQAGYMPELLQAVEAVNQFQKQRLHALISLHFC